jgi:hypothetical protein
VLEKKIQEGSNGKSCKIISKGGSSNRPPLFEGDDYYYWKDKMELFLRSQDNNMWSVIETGEYIPLTKDTTTSKPQSGCCIVSHGLLFTIAV